MNAQRAVHCSVVVSAVCLIPGFVKPVHAQGQWQYVCPETPPNSSVHAVHMSNEAGTILIWHLSASEAQLVDPLACTVTAVPSEANVGCSGHVCVRDGAALIVGGGNDNAKVWMFRSGTWGIKASMSAGRFYPTCTALGDGRVLVLGGDNSAGPVVYPSIYEPISDTWQDLTGAVRDVGQYPFAFLLRSGKVAVVGGHDHGSGSDIHSSGHSGPERGALDGAGHDHIPR